MWTVLSASPECQRCSLMIIIIISQIYGRLGQSALFLTFLSSSQIITRALFGFAPYVQLEEIPLATIMLINRSATCVVA
jgi:uncharacterized membrane protein YkvI